MRCVIARFPFELTKSGVLESMRGVKPEEVTGESVVIGRRVYPVKQVGQVVTGQDRRDFTVREVVLAMTKLGFTCRGLPSRPDHDLDLDAVRHASAALGAPTAA
ncbi:SCO5918 family protein [Streptomyces sp. NPDC056049]|uniref:SCO5918 family protein n=1 Tax=Streptomyces sp. NPDC056049 TaxID=3345693 RepID=UPI0035DAF682